MRAPPGRRGPGALWCPEAPAAPVGGLRPAECADLRSVKTAAVGTFWDCAGAERTNVWQEQYRCELRA